MPIDDRHARRAGRHSGGAAAARVATGPQPRAGELHARTRARQDDGHRGRRHPARPTSSCRRASRPRSGPPAWSAGARWCAATAARSTSARARIGRVYEISDNGDKRTSRVVVDKLTQPSGVALRNGVALRGGDRQGAALRRHRGQPRRAAGRHDRGVQAAARSSTTTGSTSRSGPTASSTCRSARRATSASRRPNTRRSAATTPTARAWR